MPMLLATHPWFAELALAWRNRVRAALAAWPQTVFHLAAWCALLAPVVYAWTFLEGDRPGLVIQGLLRQWPAAVIILVGASFAVTRAAVLALRAELRYGWWGAMPIAPAAERRALTALAGLIALGEWLGLALLLAAIALTAQYWRRWFGPALTLSAICLPAGAALGLLAAWRAARVDAPDAGRERHYGKALLKIPLLDRGPLSAVQRWQRLETVSRWRAGGAAWKLAIVGCMIPAGTAWQSMMGLVLFAVAIIWLGVALKASEDSIEQLTQLLDATPLRFRSFACAAVRFPLFAAAATAAAGAFALHLQDAPALFVWLFALALLAGVGLELALVLRFRHHVRRARLLLTAELILLVAVAQVAWPALPVIYPLLLAYHLRSAR